jgi:serine/threonine protein kinase
MLKSCSDGRNYELLKYLTKSSGSMFYLVREKSTLKEFVLKRSPIGDDLKFNETLKEILCLMKLKNKHICEIVDFYVEKNLEEEEKVPYNFCLIMPFYQVDLHKFILKNKVDEKVCFFLTHN